MTPWGSGSPLDANPRTVNPSLSTVVYTLTTTKGRLPLKLARSSFLRFWSMTRERLFVFSQSASWSPTLTSRDRVLSDAAASNKTTTTTRLTTINFKNLNILNFGRGSVIVVNSGTRSLAAHERFRRGCWVSDTCWTESVTAQVDLVFFKTVYVYNIWKHIQCILPLLS